MVFGLVRVVTVNRQISRIVLLGRSDRVVIPNGAIAIQDLIDHFLAVEGMFQREPDIVVVERCRPRIHRKTEVLVAGH